MAITAVQSHGRIRRLMFFDSTVYLVFLLLVTLLYWRLRFRAQNCFLLLASYFFYGWWDWRFLLLMGASTGVDFLVGRGLDKFTHPRQRSEEHTSELQSRSEIVCRLLLEKKKKNNRNSTSRSDPAYSVREMS